MTDTRCYSIYKVSNELIPNEILYSMSLLGRAGVVKTCKNMLHNFACGRIDKDTDYHRILNKDTKFSHLHLEFVEGGLATKDDAEKRKKELMTPTPRQSEPEADLKARLVRLEADYVSQLSAIKGKIDAIRSVIQLL